MSNSMRIKMAVDACLAPLIQMLNDYGIHTVGCCCGHGKDQGSIIIEQDKKLIKILVGEVIHGR